MQLKGGRVKVAGYRSQPMSLSAPTLTTHLPIKMSAWPLEPRNHRGFGENSFSQHTIYHSRPFLCTYLLKKRKCVVKQTKVHASASHQKAAVSLHWECNEDEAWLYPLTLRMSDEKHNSVTSLHMMHGHTAFLIAPWRKRIHSSVTETYEKRDSRQQLVQTVLWLLTLVNDNRTT